MRFAILLESQEGLSWADLLSVAGHAEALGYEGVYVSDHYGPVDMSQPRDVLPAWMEIAVLAARTANVRVGPLVSPVTFRHPVDLAHQAIALDVLTGGRVDLGMGAGWHEEEHVRFGRDFPGAGERVSMLEESLDLVTRLWQETDVTWSGSYFSVRNVTMLPRPVTARPPIILGGWGARMLRLAALYAKEWNCFYKTVDEVERIQAEMDDVCTSVGRRPSSLRRSLMTPLIVGRDEAEVGSRIDRHREIFSGLPEDAGAWRASGMLGGTVEEIREQLSRLESAGVGRVIFEFNDVTDLAALDLLASEFDLAQS
ncbi:MAG TPA: hypothetical protein DCQ36_03140 [Actinobacteria bacterium]|nr:hypothetical protein [Actinomycetota bacterium]